MNVAQVKREVDPKYLDALERERTTIWIHLVLISLVFGIVVGFVAGWMVAAQVMHP